MKQLIDEHEYPLLRYRESKTDGERKAWMTFIQRYEPDLYKRLKEEQANG